MRPVDAPSGRVGITIVTYDAPDGLLERCVTRVLETAGDAAAEVAEVVVVDTGGRAAARLVEAGARDRVELVTLDANPGFGAALAAGVDRCLAAGAEVVVGLNDDVVVGEGWLAPLVDALESDPELGAVQPLLVQLDSDPPVVDSAGVEIDRFGAGADASRGRLAAQVASGPVDVVTGGAAAWSARFIRDVGPIDTRFFLYYEDVEWCRRGARAGWAFRVVAESRVAHAGSASTVRLGDDVRRLQERNRLWCSAMHGTAAEFGRGLWLSVRRLRHEPRRTHAMALASGLVGAVPRLARRMIGRSAMPTPRTPGPPSFLRRSLDAADSST